MANQKACLMGLLIMSALLAVAQALAHNAGECSENKPCAGGECCSKYGYCGCTDAYCGAGCVGNCNGCNNNNGANAIEKTSAHGAHNVGECSESKPCAGGECCSQYGYCGCTDAYCGAGCVGNCNGCNNNNGANAIEKASAHGAHNVGECSESKPCAGGECCSQYGYCGCTDAYCGAGCVGNCNGCNNNNGANAIEKTSAHGAHNVGECSESKPCAGGECCSQYGYCGCTDAYCGPGCVGNCNGCNNNRASSSGQATYYDTYVPSSCYGYDTSQFPSGPMIAAASSNIFSNKAACGSYWKITCRGAVSGGSSPCSRNPTVKVKVVDLCPGCNRNSFDLSKEAFAKIANVDAGRITISATRVSIQHDDEQVESIVQVV